MQIDINMIVSAIVLVFIITLGGIYINGFKNWLVWAVTEAEAMFGSKTGQLKLRFAYELAAERFPLAAKLIPFNVFSKMIDDALDIMRAMIEKNQNIAEVVTSKTNGENIKNNEEG